MRWLYNEYGSGMSPNLPLHPTRESEKKSIERVDMEYKDHWLLVSYEDDSLLRFNLTLQQKEVHLMPTKDTSSLQSKKISPNLVVS